MADARDSKSRIERCEGSSPSPGTMEKVLVIVGPTASGKSDLAVELARALNGEIISADSRQVYKGLDIGTGKITKKEMRGVKHHLLDVADARKQFSVAQYKNLAEKALKEIIDRGKLPIIVGGTGFYIDAVTGRNSLPDVPPNKMLRKQLESKSTEELFTILEKKDPARAESIDKHNRVRLVRALEIVGAIGKVPKPKPTKQKYEYIWIGLKPERELLEEKILKRLGARIPGMIKEAKKLHKNGLSYRRLEELGLEYRYLARLLQNQADHKQFVDELFREIRHYSKRQMTWFKGNKNITWFSSSDAKPIREHLAGLI